MLKTVARYLTVATLAISVVALVGVSRAKADSISISNPNPALSAFTGPYADVTVVLDSSTEATIEFTSLTATSGNADCTSADPCAYLMGDSGSAAVNVNASSFSETLVTDSYFKQFDSGEEDGFGSFNLKVDNTDGFKDAVSTIVFDITDLSGNWSSALDVLMPNAGGSTVASHIYVTSELCTGACVTGYGANGVEVPEPSATALMGFGLVGLASLLILKRRFFEADSQA